MSKVNLGWNSLSGRLVINFVAFLLILVAVFTVMPVFLARSAFHRSLASAASVHFADLSPDASSVLAGGNAADLKEELGQDIKGNVVYLAVVDEQGKVVAHSDPSAEGSAFQGPLPAADGIAVERLLPDTEVADGVFDPSSGTRPSA